MAPFTASSALDKTVSSSRHPANLAFPGASRSCESRQSCFP